MRRFYGPGPGAARDRGPLTHPFGLVAVLALNALWGPAAGAVALGARSALDGRQRWP
ncbi:hypothetical protein [Nocardiopsis dassonvillei]|uniref:hypothetical protein n=1 Tax=Nocardiopsis dassonvillei TaxID=2014 RepID=UPI0036407C80